MFTRRPLMDSPAVFTAAVEKVCTDYGMPMPEIKLSDYNGEAYIKGYVYCANADSDLTTMVHRELAKENAE
jgi:hypothetical protein